MQLTGALLAVLAALSNAVGSVLQRMASRHHDPAAKTWPGVLALLRQPAWSAGIGAHVVGFVLQGVALGLALISVVQPVLIAELPLTLILSSLLLGTPMRRRAWLAVGATAGGVALFLNCLAPYGGAPQDTPASSWWIGSVAVIVATAVLAVLGVRRRGPRRAQFFGIATGLTYGYNAALLAGIAAAWSQGWPAVLTAWQTYGLLVGGTVSFVFLQQALQAGDLLAAQPAITLTSPLIALGWGFVVFGERVEVGPWLLGAALGAVAIVVGTRELSRAALLATTATTLGAEAPGRTDDTGGGRSAAAT